jgi:predicted HicB family RNase H-like nuclease
MQPDRKLLSKSERKTEKIVFRIQPSIKAAASALAAKDRRTLGQFVGNMLADRVAALRRVVAA